MRVEGALNLSLSATQVAENAGSNAVQARLTRSGSTAQASVASISASSGDLVVPATVTIPVGAVSVTFGIGAVTLLVANLLMRPILLTLFEPNVAAAQGVPVRSMQYLVFGLLVLSLVASLQAVGCVLSVGLLVAPAATISLLTDKTSALFWGGGLLGAAGAVGGVLISAKLNLSAGPTIVMLLGALFLLAWLFGPKYGLFAKNTPKAH